MRINDLLDTAQLGEEIKVGYVTERYHPEFPELAILNYTDKCQFDRNWNDVTMLTRGLIYNRDSGEILARPFPKFFNYGDPNAGQLDLDMPILSAHDKLDGSLGIAYVRPDGKVAIATRGSFVSEQAIHATERLTRYDAEDIAEFANLGLTQLFEIVYPDNRIVLDYGDRDELVYLGRVDDSTGRFYPVCTSGEDIFGGTLRDVLEREPRKNAEGFVVWLNRTTAIKIKQADYIALHRIVSNLSVKEVWRQLRDGTFDEFVVALPDEFYDWANKASDELLAQHDGIMATAVHAKHDLLAQNLATRKEQALWIQANVPADLRGLVFGLLDGKEITPAIWRMIEPKGVNGDHD